jgi:hypothetical protein
MTMITPSASSIPLIYKHPILQRSIIGYEHRYNFPGFYNPHETLSELLKDEKNFIIHRRKISRNESPKAISMMRKNPQIIRMESLIYNDNPEIINLVNRCMSDVQPGTDLANTMSETHNPLFLQLLEKCPSAINWKILSSNECDEALRIIQNNQDKIVWEEFSKNSHPLALEIIQKNPDKIVWSSFCFNSHPTAIAMIEQMLVEDQSKIDFAHLSGNPSAIHIILQHLDKVNSYFLSENPNAMDILMDNPHLINNLSITHNPNAIPYLETQMENFANSYDISNILRNPNGIPLIQQMLDYNLVSESDIEKTISYLLFEKKNIERVFELDYQAMSKVRTKLLYDEILEKALHPDRVSKWLDYHCENGGNIIDFEF